MFIKHTILFIFYLISTTILSGQDSGIAIPDILQSMKHMVSDVDRQFVEEIVGEIRKKQKSTLASKNQTNVLLGLPFKQNDNYNDPGYFAISNYVDWDASYPDKLLDFNCGQRSYDREHGYNHNGTDFYAFPYSWSKMKNNQVEIIAAAPGIIIKLTRANKDGNCSYRSNNWNAIAIEHADGSVAIYGHLKQHSLTSKGVGDFVNTGEFLGIMGSSGNSTEPHLHFEVYNSEGNLIDPYAGKCNPSVSESYWSEQENYYEPQINKLMTHPEYPKIGCHNDEELISEVNFTFGQKVYFATYYRDRIPSSVSYHKVIKPDGSVFKRWYSTAHNYSSGLASWIGCSLPETGDIGKWIFTVDYYNQTYAEYFYLTDEMSINSFSLSHDTLYIENCFDNTIGFFEIINSGNTGLIVDSITSTSGIQASWNGLVHAGERKLIHIKNYQKERFVLERLTISTNFGSKDLYVSCNMNEEEIDLIPISKSVTISPNPTSGEFIVDFGVSYRTGFYELLDFYGNSLEYGYFDKAYEIRLSIQSEGGLFLLKIIDDKNQWVICKVIKY